MIACSAQFYTTFAGYLTRRGFRRGFDGVYRDPAGKRPTRWVQFPHELARQHRRLILIGCMCDRLQQLRLRAEDLGIIVEFRHG